MQQDTSKRGKITQPVYIEIKGSRSKKAAIWLQHSGPEIGENEGRYIALRKVS